MLARSLRWARSARPAPPLPGSSLPPDSVRPAHSSRRGPLVFSGAYCSPSAPPARHPASRHLERHATIARVPQHVNRSLCGQDGHQSPPRITPSGLRATLQTWPGCQLRIWPLRGLANDLRRAEQHGTPPPSLIAPFRTYRFERSSGGFAINGRFFDLNVDNAVIRTGTYDAWESAERQRRLVSPCAPALAPRGP